MYRNREHYFYTVFARDPTEVPQDFDTYEEAKEYGDEVFGEGNYTIVDPL